MIDPEEVIPSVLLVDDHKDVLIIAGSIISQAGYDVRTASSAAEALKSIKRFGMPHLAVIDINMPGMDGIELGHRLKSLGEVPIIMLTAQSQESIVVKALEEFADDYIVKPYQSKELVARIERVLRRMEDFDYTVNLNVNPEVPFHFDFRSREVVEGDVSISLTPTEARLLYLLMKQNNGIVHVNILMDRLWPAKNVPEDRLRVHVSRLRRKLHSLPSNKDYIFTERGKGYGFQS